MSLYWRNARMLASFLLPMFLLPIFLGAAATEVLAGENKSSLNTNDPATPPDGFESRFEAVNGVRIHYVSGGKLDGPALVLIAGYPESWFAWRKVIPYFAEAFHVVAIDLPGQGDSDRPSGGYDTGSLGDLVDEFLHQIGTKNYNLVGHDVGAWVAFTQASRHPDSVTKLVLIDASIPGVTLPDQIPVAPDKAWRSWHFPFMVIPDLPEVFITGREREWLSWFFVRKTADPTTFKEEDYREYLRAITAPGGLRAGLAYYRAAPLSAEQNKQAHLRMPVLGIGGEQGSSPDMATPLRKFADEVIGVTIKKSGHFIPDEKPEDLAREIANFLQRN